ncbi:dTDP-4-amino-4,6-dideoxygalactose transaminase [Pseudoalteromonas sp. BZB3]|uniref:dTDP-4-amino-4,6-dideoxygalactose transaminase n=1 Tax=Pseudoalteromonas sp. BZB3 TaxID=3136670 RepID=UPI0032C4ABBB
MIPFNRPPVLGTEINYIQDAISKDKLCGDGPFSKSCQTWFEEHFDTRLALLTPSCTAALEMAAILLDIKPDDEVIMPSYTFVSTSNAFVLRGAKIVFADIRPDTMNIDETKIESLITEKTKAIVPVHYAGVACEMDTIMQIAAKHDLYVVEDAAQGVMSTYKGKALGTIGHIGCYSFHATKNYTSGGEGGLLLVNDEKFAKRAEIVREKGTDRSLFFRGMVDKYSWVDLGSSFLPSEIQAAYLWGQLEGAEQINTHRLTLWLTYYEGLKALESKGLLELPKVPEDCKHNAHMFYIKCQDLAERQAFISYMKEQQVQTAFHYVPLHSSSAGIDFGLMDDDTYTTIESERIVRLPMYFSLEKTEVNSICQSIISFFLK